MAELTQEMLKELLSYDQYTGVFVWLKKPSNKSNRVKVGSVAGSPHSHGYVTIRLFGKLYFAHRLAWFYMYGEWPDVIDHINHASNDNRLSNLRNVSQSLNLKNQRASSRNKSKHPGVHWNRRDKKWVAQIGNNKTIHLGYFSNKDEAIAARKTAEKRYGYHPNHGK